MINVEIQNADGTLQSDDFLIDSGADCTVLSAAVFQRSNLPASPTGPGLGLVGIGGSGGFVVVSTVLVFRRSDGGTATVRGTIAAFTVSTPVHFCILGRDILDNFDVILSRPRNEVLLLAPNHGYQVLGGP